MRDDRQQDRRPRRGDRREDRRGEPRPLRDDEGHSDHNAPASHPRAKKRFSQNFLVDGNMARKIVDLCQVRPDDTVIEIGAGTGALTRHLLRAAGHLHAVELDRELFEGLRVEFEDEPKLTLHQADILKLRVRNMIPGGRALVVGNLPYAITHDLVLWLLDQHADIRRAVVLMQREVAARLCAEPGERIGGTMTLAVHYRAEAERILDVPPGCFRPVPKVTSSLVAFRFRDEPPVHPRDEAFFFRVIRAAFGERRKTLANSLAAGLGEPRALVEGAVRDAGLDPMIRGERLTLEEFTRLADRLGEPRADGSARPEAEPRADGDARPGGEPKP